MKHKRFKIVGLVIVIALGLGGWYWWSHASDDKSASTASVRHNTNVTFTDNTAFTPEVKNEIAQKVANPIVVYHTVVLHKPLSAIHIDVSEPANPDDYRYKLTYDGGSGFLFGANQQIGYWLPPLCDDSDKCDEYPATFKKMFPDTYTAYQACQTATKAGDKEAANLACAP